MPAQQFEPMSVGGILDRAFTLYRRRFLHFLAIVAIVQVPLGLGAAFLSVLATALGTAAQTREQEVPSALLIVAGVVWLGVIAVSIVGGQLSTAALLKSVSEAYLGRETTVSEAYRFVLPRLLALIGAALLVGLLVTLGYILCIVPGVIFSLWYALTIPAIVLEGLGPVNGMKRSRDLVAGNLGRVFLVLLVVFLITLVLTQAFQFGGQLTGSVVAQQSPLAGVFLTQVFGFAAQIIAMPLGAGATILVYYDLRIRKEAFDLEMLAESLGSKEPPPDVDRPEL